MKQRTAKTIGEVLGWIEHTPHHRAEVRGDLTKGGDGLVLFSDDTRFDVPNPLWKEASIYIRVAHAGDDRMYRATDHGRELLRSLGQEPANRYRSTKP